MSKQKKEPKEKKPRKPKEPKKPIEPKLLILPKEKKGRYFYYCSYCNKIFISSEEKHFLSKSHKKRNDAINDMFNPAGQKPKIHRNPYYFYKNKNGKYQKTKMENNVMKKIPDSKEYTWKEIYEKLTNRKTK